MIEQWPEAVEGAHLLDSLHDAIRAYLIVSDVQAAAILLWIVHAWAHDAADSSPRLVFTSPEKRCGKTRGMELLARLCPRSMLTSGITASALFRMIEKHFPTVLIDEWDTVMKGDREKAEALRQVVNAGFDRAGARIFRCEARSHEPREFCAWAPLALAGIRDVPETIKDRGILIAMRRKLLGQKVRRLRARDGGDLLELKRKLARWTADNLERLRNSDPTMPASLNDRMADAWAPLFAIADAAGGSWPERALASALALARDDDDQGELSTMLLGDIQILFAADGADALPSANIVSGLLAMADRPWGEIAGKPLTANRLAKMLAPYGIRPMPFRDGDGRQQRGYQCADLEPVWQRYLPAATAP